MTLRELIDQVTDYNSESLAMDYKLLINTYSDITVKSYTEMTIKSYQVDDERKIIKLEVI